MPHSHTPNTLATFSVFLRTCFLRLLVLGTLGLAACGSPPTPQPSPTPTVPPPTATPVPPTATTMPAPATYQPVFAAEACEFKVPAGAAVECGFLTVPEERTGDLTDTIQLAVAIYRSPSANPAPDPVLFLQGGPGSSAVAWSTDYYTSFITPILAERDFIIFDQRGVGLSIPELNCREVVSTYLQDFREELVGEERAERYATALGKCRDRLTQQGANLSAYNTTASAADVHDLVTTLGYDQVNLYGASYGTRLAQAVMRDFPTLVRSAVLDSALPLEVQLYNQGAANAQASLQTLFAGCAAQPACQAAYPNLETTFADLSRQLATQPLTVTVADPVTGLPQETTVSDVRLLSLLLWTMNYSTLVPLIPRTIAAVQAGDYAVLEYALSLPAATYANISIGVLVSVNCHDQVLTTTPEELGVDLAAYPDTEAYGLSGAYGSTEALFEICEIWGTAPDKSGDGKPDEAAPLASDVPTLILAGEYDPTTPAVWGEQLAAHLSHSHFISFPGQSHTPSLDPEQACPLSLALAFLRDPTQTPDRACVAEMADWEFDIPFTTAQTLTFEPYTNTEKTLMGWAPAGWKYLGDGFYNRNRSLLDYTQVGMQGVAISTEAWVEFLNAQYSGRGFDAPLEAAGELEAGGRRWQLYTATFDGHPVDIAFAEGTPVTLMVAMLTHADEHAAYYEALFLQMLERVRSVE